MLTKQDLKVNNVYRAKRPLRVFMFSGDLYNDRQILYINEDTNLIQYDSPSVNNGRHYPRTTIEKFLKWANRDVTEECPKDEWIKYPRKF